MNKKVYRISLLLYSALMFTVSSIPKLSAPHFDTIIGTDKIAHFGEYFIFGFLYLKNLQYKAFPKINTHFLLIFLFILPILDEIHQIPIPGRQFSFYDIIADLFGLFFISLIMFLRKKSRID